MEPVDWEGLPMKTNEIENNRFKVARNGEHTMRMFQCDDCQFCNLKRRLPGWSLQDQLLQCCLRRANLDSFWSRESGTVRNHVGEVRKQLEYGGLVRVEMFP
jgi:hypothetical protein